jgi:hypothetical protein
MEHFSLGQLTVKSLVKDLCFFIDEIYMERAYDLQKHCFKILENKKLC